MARRSLLALFSLAVVLFTFVGCSGTSNDAASSSVPGVSPTAPTAPADAEDDPAKTPLTDEELAEIKKLPDEADQKAAIAQKVCPFTGEHLGSMGMPIKKVVDGKPVFLCCSGCNDKFEKDPQGALAKVSQKQ